MAVRVVVTGGLGFIGSNLVRWLLAKTEAEVVNIDALTYAGNPANLAEVAEHPRYRWVRASIADSAAMHALFSRVAVDAVMNLAAESHVDRSIQDALPFVRTNVEGTQILLEMARRYGVARFLQVSTDEVYGSLEPHEAPFSEDRPLAPNSPYAASKAAADLLALAAHRTFGLPVIVSRCSNNYGPYQFPEKLIPLLITNALEGKQLPIYGDGEHRRDWIHVSDHVRGLWLALTQGQPGRVYNFGAANERSNREVAAAVCRALAVDPQRVVSVADRPGHDRRYAIDASRSRRELGFVPQVDWETGLTETVAWYRRHSQWWQPLKQNPGYQAYYRARYSTQTG